MKQIKLLFKYSVLPSVGTIIVLSIIYLCLRLLGNYNIFNNISDDAIDVMLMIFFVFPYVGSIIFSSVLSRKIPFFASFCFAILTTLIIDFFGALISFPTAPILMINNYRLFNAPVFFIILTLVIVGLTKAFMHFKARRK